MSGYQGRILVQMPYDVAESLGELTIVGNTSGWNHGGESVYELELRDRDVSRAVVLLRQAAVSLRAMCGTDCGDAAAIDQFLESHRDAELVSAWRRAAKLDRDWTDSWNADLDHARAFLDALER